MSLKLLSMALLSYTFLLLVAGSILVAVPKLQVHKLSPVRQEHSSIDNTFPGNRRRLLSHQDAVTTGGAFRASLVRATFATNVTRAARLSEAANRSKARAKALVSEMKRLSASSRSKLAASKLDYYSSVASIAGAYTMDLYLGTPPQKFSAIVDTGSDLVWIQCKPCTQCYSQKDAIFTPTASSTFSKTSCTTSTCQSLPANACSKSGRTCLYGYQYGDASSTQGDFALETLTLTSTDGSKKGFPNFQFGCGRLNSGSFGGAAGIVGLGQGQISLNSQISSAIGNKFSYCLVDFDDDSSQTSPLLFGAAAAAVTKGISTPIIPNSVRSTYYFVGLEAVEVGGKQLSLSTKSIRFTGRDGKSGRRIRTTALEVNSGGTIFDSGTTLTMFDDGVYAKIKTAFSGSITLRTVDGSSAGFDLCYDVSKNKGYKFPALTLAFKGARFSPPQKNYFVLVDTAETVACLAMAGSGSLGLGIIGNLMQQNYHVLYDRAAGVISLSPAQCDSL